MLLTGGGGEAARLCWRCPLKLLQSDGSFHYLASLHRQQLSVLKVQQFPGFWWLDQSLVMSHNRRMNLTFVSMVTPPNVWRQIFKQNSTANIFKMSHSSHILHTYDLNFWERLFCSSLCTVWLSAVNQLFSPLRQKQSCLSAGGKNRRSLMSVGSINLFTQLHSNYQALLNCFHLDRQADRETDSLTDWLVFLMENHILYSRGVC